MPNEAVTARTRPALAVATLALVGALLAPTPARAQAAEGEGEGNACTPRCVDATTLAFCDAGAPVTLTCADVDPTAQCAPLSPAWGDDCVLGDGAACDPGYAFGHSRCDEALSLFCVDAACTLAAGPPAAGPPLEPDPGTTPTATTTTTASCLGCAGAPDAAATGALAGALLLVRGRRRRVP